MRSLFESVVAAAALNSVTLATWQTVHLNNDWLVEYEPSSCSLEVYKLVSGQSTSRVKVFESDENLLGVGFGDVDDINIMTAGNISNFPKVQNRSVKMRCGEAEVANSSDKVSFGGKIVISEASENSEEVSTDFSLELSGKDENRLGFKATAEDAHSAVNGTNYFSMRYRSDPDEEIYGMGLQYTEWDFKGKSVPLISTEAGVGRGLQPITTLMNALGGQGGKTTTSYAPAAQYITNKQRGFIYDQTSIGIASFDERMATEMLYWHQDTISGTVLYGEDFMALSQELSQTVGTMAALPKWSLQGAIVGIVGGQEFVDEKYAMMKELELPMVGLWMQDWVGEHTYPEGTRLIWNWQLKRDWYYDWDNMVENWAADGVRPFIYINPYIQDTSEVEGIRQDQFSEGCENGYFVKDQTGEVLLINSLSIRFAMVDFTNPDAWNWMKSIIKDNLVAEGRAGGWMHDFGEYLPFDAVLFDGSDPVEYHNKYPEDWAAVVHEALSEVEDGEDIVYFMRAGSGTSPQNTRLYWMGDQLTTLDQYDGLESALIGLMNGGMSGATIGHSDIGGYTSIIEQVAGKTILEYTRNKETLQRWIEMNTFSDPIQRSHPSNIPEAQHQIYDDDDTVLFFKKFVDIHVKLADYKMDLMKEAERKGTPFTRPLMLQFPDDKKSRRTKSEFLLGENILVAPIFKLGMTSRDIYLPGPAQWTHLWSGLTYSVDSAGMTLQDFSAPIGSPAVFTRDTDSVKMSEILADVFSQTEESIFLQD